MTQELDREIFQELIDRAEIDNDDVRKEYGWGYGKTCVGVVVDSDDVFRTFMVEAGRYAAELDSDDLPSFDAIELVKSARTDDMGRDRMIFYFPYLKLTG